MSPTPSGPISFVLPALLGLVVGFGVAFVVLGGGDSGPPIGLPGELPAASGGSDGPVRRTSNDTGALSGRVSSSDTGIAEASGSLPPAVVADAISRIEVPLETRGSGSGTGELDGTVVGHDGNPLAGVVVVATGRGRSISYGRSTDKVGAGAPVVPSLEDHLRENAESWAEKRALRFQVVTDEQGRFRFSGLPDATFSVRGYVENHVCSSQPAGYVPSGVSVAIQARPVQTLTVDVRMPDGSAPKVAALLIENGDDTNTYKWTPTERTLRLEDRVGTVTALAEALNSARNGEDGFAAQYRSEPVLLDPEDTAPVELKLEVVNGIYGSVVDERGTNGWKQVKLVALSEGESFDDDMLKNAAESYNAWGGDYHFSSLQPGRYGVGLVLGQGSVLVSQEVVVESGMVECDLRVGPPDPSNAVHVLCVDDAGRNLRGVTFRYEFHRQYGSHSSSVNARDDSDGTYWIEPEQMIEGNDYDALSENMKLYLTAQHSRYGKRTEQLEGGQREVRFEFTEPSTLHVQLVGYEGHEYARQIKLKVKPKGDERHNSDDDATITRGEAVFRNLAQGEYEVSLEFQVERWNTRTIHSEEIVLGPGEQSISLEVPRLYSLEVSAPDHEPGTGMWIQHKDGDEWKWGGNGQTGSDRRVTFEGLAAGDYNLSASGASKPMSVTVPSGPVVFRAPEFDCFKVSISDEDGILYRTGLRAGDLVIAVDGEAFAKGNLWGDLWKKVRKGNTTLTILRDGQRLEFTSGDEGWQGPDSANYGGSFVQAARSDG